MADLAVACPLGEHDFADEFRFDPMRSLCDRSFRRRIERAAGLLDRLELPTEIERDLVREAGADLAAEDEPVSFEIADQKRADAGARPFRIGESPDHEFLLEDAFRL